MKFQSIFQSGYQTRLHSLHHGTRQMFQDVLWISPAGEMPKIANQKQSTGIWDVTLLQPTYAAGRFFHPFIYSPIAPHKIRILICLTLQCVLSFTRQKEDTSIRKQAGAFNPTEENTKLIL